MAALYGAPSPSDWSLSVGGDPLASATGSVYVGNLAWDVTSEELHAHFVQTGAVVKAELPTGHNGRSRGYGIVVFESAHDANNAITSMNETEFKGRMMIVREDSGGRQSTGGNSRARGGGGGGNGGGGGGGNMTGGGTSLYVGGLSWDVTSAELSGHFQQAGRIVSADVRAGNDGQSRGYGVVVFESPQEANNAIAMMNETEFKGRTMIVREDRQGGRSRRGGGGEPGTTIYIGNLPPDTHWKAVKDMCKGFGNCDHVEVFTARNNSCYATASFSSGNDAGAALAGLPGVQVEGYEITAKWNE